MPFNILSNTPMPQPKIRAPISSIFAPVPGVPGSTSNNKNQSRLSGGDVMPGNAPSGPGYVTGAEPPGYQSPTRATGYDTAGTLIPRREAENYALNNYPPGETYGVPPGVSDWGHSLVGTPFTEGWGYSSGISEAGYPGSPGMSVPPPKPTSEVPTNSLGPIISPQSDPWAGTRNPNENITPKPTTPGLVTGTPGRVAPGRPQPPQVKQGPGANGTKGQGTIYNNPTKYGKTKQDRQDYANKLQSFRESWNSG
jgi:hypothetical protein